MLEISDLGSRRIRSRSITIDRYHKGLEVEVDIRVAKTKALISFAVTAKLICAFVFAYAKSRFSHNEAHIVTVVFLLALSI